MESENSLKCLQGTKNIVRVIEILSYRVSSYGKSLLFFRFKSTNPSCGSMILEAGEECDFGVKILVLSYLLRVYLKL